MIKSRNNILVGLKKIEDNKFKSPVYFDNKTKNISSHSVHKNNWLEKRVHVYLLSKEAPKLGDWVFDDAYFLNSKMEEDWDAIAVYQTDEEYYQIGKEACKIISTSDPDVKKPMSKQQLKELIEIFNKK